MEELLQAPTKGYGEAIVIPEILAENFEIKTNLLQLVHANKFHGFEIDNSHTHISAARVWYEKEPPNSILTWEDLVNKFISNLVEIVNKQVIAPAKAIEKTCVTCGGAHAYYECIATNSNPSSIYSTTGSYNQVSPPNRASHQIPPPGFAPVQNNPNSNTIPNPKREMKAVTTRGGLAYEGPSIPTESSLEKVDEQNTNKEQSNSSGSTAQVQPPIVPIPIPELDVLRTQTKPTISYPSSFVDALLLMPKFSSTIKSLLANKDKLFELAKVPLNGNCSAMLLKKLPEKLGDPELTPTRMTLELADRSITRSKGVAEDVFVKVGKFHFPTDFVVVDFEADPRVPLILGRSFLRTVRALIDVYEEEITLRVDVVDIACEEFVQDVLDFQYNPKSRSPTLVFNDLISESDSIKVPIVKNSSPTFTPFGEKSKEKSSVEEPPELKLKELPSHLEYVFLEDSNKLPVIIAKNLKVDEKETLINVFKSHKQTIAWKISDIKGIDPRFCTHKILIEDDYKPAIQSQRRVNPKIHDVIQKEVIKLLDACMIYPISDSQWVSPIHYVPKKGCMTVVANENNELIPTRLVTGWRVCIDYRKLNDATRKDHFPLPFMDQMLERLAGNEFYCFLDGTFQRCMMSIFHDMIEKTIEVFMDNFLVFGDSFSSCLTNLDKMLNRCEETNLVLNWEKCHFRCREGIVLGHKISKSGIEVDREKVDVIAKLPHSTTVKGVRSFLGHAGTFQRCMMSIFHDMIEKTIEVFMDNFLVFGDSFSSCLTNLDK
nr:hypothetical protein [Tanacetum cinerariifolium]